MKRYIHSSTYISAAIDRNKLLVRLDAWGEEVAEHLAKCAMYGDSLGQGKYDHWIKDELATWISDANEAICKHNNGKLKPKQYEDTLFGFLGDSYVEARMNLHALQSRNKRYSDAYPFKQVDSAMIERMYSISNAVIAKFVPLLSSKNTFTKDDVEILLHSVIDPVCKNVE